MQQKYLFIILVELFMLLIFTEIIELNFCNLNHNTKKNIIDREEKLREMDERSDDSGIIIGSDLKISETAIDEKTSNYVSYLVDSE